MDNTMRDEARAKAERIEANVRIRLRRWVRLTHNEMNAKIVNADTEQLVALVEKLGGDATAMAEEARKEMIDTMMVEMDR